jgi:hypothetical protein
MVSLLATAMMAVGLLTSTPQPLEWQADYGKALAATREGNQPLLVVLDKPESRVDASLLGEGKIEGEQFDLLRPYHLCHVDASTEYGQKVAKAFDAKKFPYVAIIDKSGSVVIFSKEGKIASNDWEAALKSNKDGDRTSKPTTHVSYKVSVDPNAKPGEPGYCPNCHKHSM